MSKKAEKLPATASKETIDKAVASGKALVEQGKTKMEAAIAIYAALKDQPQQTVVDAFIAGAKLTPRGALTYWYTCRRRTPRDKKEPAHAKA